MKLSITTLALLFSSLAFAETSPEIGCDSEISKALEARYYAQRNLNMFDRAGATKVLSRTEKFTVQKAILEADGGYSIYEVVTRNKDCKILALEFVYSD